MAEFDQLDSNFKTLLNNLRFYDKNFFDYELKMLIKSA